jgi:transcriptional regulator with GAF, ATPase, and Fis domain
MVTNAISVIPSDSSARSELIGSNRGLRKPWDSLHKVARTNSVVLIHGETGTGKELVAKAIHEESFRKCGPYVKLNCAAMLGILLESEFLVQRREAFTGALTQTNGRFQHAQTGTLFLDGDLPLELQPTFLRVLQEQKYERLSSNRAIALPPLRERPEDILLLVQHLVRRCASRMNKEPVHISERAEAWEAV